MTTARADVHGIAAEKTNTAEEVAAVARLVADRDGLTSDVARMLGIADGVIA